MNDCRRESIYLTWHNFNSRYTFTGISNNNNHKQQQSVIRNNKRKVQKTMNITNLNRISKIEIKTNQGYPLEVINKSFSCMKKSE